MTLVPWILLIALDQTGSGGTKYLPAADVTKAIRDAPGGPLATVPLATSQEYRVIGVRRGAPGESELHEKEIDIWYVLEGRGSLVTGGTMADPKTTAPGEIRGSGVRGGEERQVGPGDVVTIAAGVPHWVRQVEGTLRYLVIKVSTKP